MHAFSTNIFLSYIAAYHPSFCLYHTKRKLHYQVNVTVFYIFAIIVTLTRSFALFLHKKELLPKAIALYSPCKRKSKKLLKYMSSDIVVRSYTQPELTAYMQILRLNASLTRNPHLLSVERDTILSITVII